MPLAPAAGDIDLCSPCSSWEEGQDRRRGSLRSRGDSRRWEPRNCLKARRISAQSQIAVEMISRSLATKIRVLFRGGALLGVCVKLMLEKRCFASVRSMFPWDENSKVER